MPLVHKGISKSPKGLKVPNMMIFDCCREGRLPSLSLIGKIGLLLGCNDLFIKRRNIILPALTGQAS